MTDHVTLTQEHSKLYHYLSAFEAEPKRQLAMEQRRFDMLAPLLKALSKASFEVLHKQVSDGAGDFASVFCAHFVVCGFTEMTVSLSFMWSSSAMNNIIIAANLLVCSFNAILRVHSGVGRSPTSWARAR